MAAAERAVLQSSRRSFAARWNEQGPKLDDAVTVLSVCKSALVGTRGHPVGTSERVKARIGHACRYERSRPGGSRGPGFLSAAVFAGRHKGNNNKTTHMSSPNVPREISAGRAMELQQDESGGPDGISRDP